MNSLNRIFFLVIFFSILMNWVVLYVVQKADPLFNWSVMIPVFILSLVISSIVARRIQPQLLKVKFNDRSLFINDVVKALKEMGFYISGSMDNHYFFKRQHYFPPQVDIVHLRFEENNECLVEFPMITTKTINKALQPYTLLREREFLKETDQLMKDV